MSRDLRIARAMRAIAHCEHIIRRMRPGRAWGEVMAAINEAHPDMPVTMGSMMRSVHSLVDEGLMPADLLTPVPSRGRRPRHAVGPRDDRTPRD